MTRSMTGLCCLAVTLGLMVPGADAQEPTSDLAQLQGVAESILAREEAASERPFDLAFRAKAKELLATLPLAELLAQTGEAGLGLSGLGDSQADLVYTPLTPCRIVDTRAAGGPIAAGTTRSFLVTGTDYSAQGGSATGCGVPYGPTTAAVVNFVAVSPAGQGNLQVTPHGSPLPTASIINYRAGVNLANGLVVAICNPSATTCTSDITIKANVSTTGLVADVQGYFQRVTTGGVGTALLADGAVTAPKISNGTVVRSLNGLADTVTLAAGTNVSITPSGNTLTLAATLGGAGDITAVNTPAGGGLQGGVTFGDANLSLATCASGQILKSGGPTWNCGTDTDTGVNAVANGGGITGSITGRTLTLASTATATNTAGAIVARDAAGSLLAGAIGLAGNLELPNTASASVGLLTKGGTPFLHNYGLGNTFVGANAGNLSMTGSNNTGVGLNTLQANTTANNNSAFGNRALQANTSGLANSAFGQGALGANTTGSYNSAFGPGTLSANTTGWGDSAFGHQALFYNTTGSSNSAVGYQALLNNTTGETNSALGYQALNANTTGSYNSAYGGSALLNNTTGGSSSAFGHMALYANSTGYHNAAFGNNALYNSTGGYNVAVGINAGFNLTSGDNNIYIANTGASSESGVIRIGTDGTHTATYIAGIYSANATARAVYVNSDGRLGTLSSSRRYKEEIVDMSAESDVLLKLRPVSFYYGPELDETHLRQYGLVAEEVAEVAPGLVDYDQDGAPQTVRYHFVNAMLLNEVQRQRRLVEEERRENEKQKMTIATLEARLARLEALLAGGR